MGLGQLFMRPASPQPQPEHRSTQYTATDTATGVSQTWTVFDNLAPDWASGVYDGALAIPGAWRASMLIADQLGSLPWDALRQWGDRPVENIPSPLLDQPNPPETRMNTFSSLALDLLFNGNGVGVYAARNSEGWPTRLLPLPASSTVIRLARRGDPFPEGELLYQNGKQLWSAKDILHIKGPCEAGSLRGMGVLEANLTTFSLARELNRQARGITTAAVPTGVVRVDDPDATSDDLRMAKTMWQEAQRDRTVAVLKNGGYQVLAWNPTESQLIEARKFSMVEIANMFGLDPAWLGVTGSSMTYQNQETKGLDLIKFSLAGHLSRFEQALTTAFPRGTYVKANLDAILRSDTLSRYQAHEIGIRAGFLTVDEVRELEERPPMPKDEMPPAVDPESGEGNSTDNPVPQLQRVS